MILSAVFEVPLLYGEDYQLTDKSCSLYLKSVSKFHVSLICEMQLICECLLSSLLVVDTDTATSFKSKRDAKKKSLSSHDHNWNTLFLGMNAVADVMADQYNTTKGSILDDASSRSLAVRMALGETQVVTETRKFLVSEGVRLDVFGQVRFCTLLS